MTAFETQPAAPGIPAFLELEITGSCQIRCVQCYNSSGPDGGHGTMTTGDWERVIGQAAALGVRTIQLIGGEPLIAPHFPRLLRCALNAGLKVSVFSNLVRVTPALWELLDAPGVSLSTSWYSKCGKLHRMRDRLPFSAR